MKYTKEALQEMVITFGEKGEFPPFYDSDNLQTRKQIGEMVLIDFGDLITRI